jgi:hypothetical protein
MKTCKEISGITPLILDLGSRSGRSTPGQEPRYALSGRLGGPETRSRRFGEQYVQWVFRTAYTWNECKNCCILHNFLTSSVIHPTSSAVCAREEVYMGLNFRRVRFTTHFHLVPRLRMRLTAPTRPFLVRGQLLQKWREINTKLPFGLSCVFNLICNRRLQRYAVLVSRSSC